MQEHTSALLAFKARLAEAGLQIPRELVVNGDLDATLYRFLRARKYNVQLAYAMLESESQQGRHCWTAMLCVTASNSCLQEHTAGEQLTSGGLKWASSGSSALLAASCEDTASFNANSSSGCIAWKLAHNEILSALLAC